jgi:hypothetical protein
MLEDLISFADLLFGQEDVQPAPGILPPGSALSRSGVISYHPVVDGPHPGSSRTKFRLGQPSDGKTMMTTSSSATSLPALAAGSHNDAAAEEVQVVAPVIAQLEQAELQSALTPDEDLDLLFDPSSIPQTMRDEIGSAYHVRIHTLVGDS